MFRKKMPREGEEGKNRSPLDWTKGSKGKGVGRGISRTVELIGQNFPILVYFFFFETNAFWQKN